MISLSFGVNAVIAYLACASVYTDGRTEQIYTVALFGGKMWQVV